ncbi:hypothetical protein BD289DRAFT_484105 [Coniella lustricola]|uniref:1-phosphatidylinositol-3-phosphate 5-kinase n=1 Tax=Coniella lustricola TaxID=2025994 RepID=A0A2T3A3B3_9PEZI|nr:hypothetical protein BD289DRAFT_484105 [Coniella lustricola]
MEPSTPVRSSMPPSIASIEDLQARRESFNSISTVSQVEKEQLAQALDKIHTSASQSDVLTTFNDFTPPPASLPVENRGSPTELVHHGISGLYTRLKEAVGAGAKPSVSESELLERLENDTRKGKATAVPAPLLVRTDGSSSQASEYSQPPGSSSASVILTEGYSLAPHSPKAPSIATTSTAKSIPSMPKIVKAAAPAVADTAVAPVTVSAFKDGDGRGVANRTDETGRRAFNLPELRTTSASRSSSIYDPSDARHIGDRGADSRPSRRQESFSQEGSSDTALSPARTSVTANSGFRGHAPRPSGDSLRKPAVIDRISRSRTSVERHSRSSSLEGKAEPSPINMSAHGSVHHESFHHNEKPEKLSSGGVRIPGTRAVDGPGTVSKTLEAMRKQVLSKEFWMADETTKECFQCGAPFSAFRRKHHCRTCGCIFDSKCTSTISGQKFGVSGNLKVCKTCLVVINSRYEGDSDDSDNDTYLPAIFRSNPLKQIQGGKPKVEDDNASIMERAEQPEASRMASAPMMAIPATRRITDANRRSAILEIDAAPQLSRPSSSRSLRSLASGRPQSSGHRRHHSKHNLLGRLKGSPAQDDSAPFRKSANEELQRKSKLPTFHDDNIIDPELAPYMSEGSSGDEQQMSIFATMNTSDITPSSLDPDKSNYGPFLGSSRRHRALRGEKSISGLSMVSRAQDDAPVSIISHGRSARRRNMSTASQTGYHMRSPRPRSGIFKGPTMSVESLAVFDPATPIEPTKLVRSSSLRQKASVNQILPEASLQHVKKLFGQLLQEADVPNPLAWERAMVPILVRCASDVDPNTRIGDLMDIRHYVKLKKIPGGKPGDTSYVSGVIFTKNLALKSMPRRIANPRIVIVSFPIEYQRHQQQHFMSLQPVIEQEKEYLRMVVNRIINLRPQVLLAHKAVSGVALQYLSEAGIAVAYNVKLAVIEAVSRCAKADIIETLDMLVLPTQVGQAGGFEVKTYVNNDYPGRKKTYIFVSGCNKSLGCTIALRGANTQVLHRMKRVIEFMVYVVYNLKLEAALLHDHLVYMGTDPEGLPTPTPSKAGADQSLASSISLQSKAVTDAASQADDSTMDSQQSSQSKTDADTTLEEELSEAAHPPPSEKTKSMLSLHSIHSGHDSHVPEDLPAPQFYSDMVAKYETKILSASPFVKFTQPYLLMKAREQERRLVHLKRLRDQDVIEEQGDNEKAKPQKFQLIKPEMVHEIGQKAPRQIMEILHAVHDAEYDKALYNYQTQTRQWENFIAGSLDLFDPYSHQNIVVLYSVICTETKIPCSEPGLIAFGFYHDDPDDNMDPDCTLGQYIEDLCGSADSICHANGCDRQMAQHHRTYVHDEARITVFIQRNSPPPFDPTMLRKDEPPLMDDSEEEDPIYLWSYCKVCKRDMGFGMLSAVARKYSFGKYLELTFWSRGLKCWPDLECPHDYQKEHIRYFNYNDTSMRIHWDPIDLLEIIVPRARLTWKVDRDLRLKNGIFTKSEERWNRFMNSVKARLKSIRIDSVLPEKADNCKAEVERLTKKAQEDQPRLIRELQSTYINSKYYEVIPLNAVIRTMLERVEDWNSAFAKFEADFLSDKDVRQLTIIQLKKMFSDNESKESLPASTDGTSIASLDTDEKTSPPTTQTSTVEGDVEKVQSEPNLPTTNPATEDQLVSVDAPNTDKATGSGQSEEACQSEVDPEATPVVAVSDPLLSDTVEEPAQEVPTKVINPPEQPAQPEATDDSATEAALASSTEELKTSSERPQLTVEEPATVSADLNAKSISPLHSPAPSRNHSRHPTLRQDSSLSLTEKVEQIRRQQQQELQKQQLASVSPEGSSSSGRSEANGEPSQRGVTPRRPGITGSTPITRSITQPVGTIPRSTPGISKPLPALPPKSAGLAVIEGESRRLSTADSNASFKSDKSSRFVQGIKPKKPISSIPRYSYAKKRDTAAKVSNLAKHFEQLSREFEKERIRDRNKRAAKLQPSRSFMPRTSAKAIVEVYEDVDQAVQEPGPSDDDHLLEVPQGIPTSVEDHLPQTDAAVPDTADSVIDPDENAADHVAEVPSQPSEDKESEQRPTSQTGSDDDGEGAASDVEGSVSEDTPDVTGSMTPILGPNGETIELPKHQKTSLMKMLTTFWNERSASGWPQLDYPFNVTDHIFIDSDVIVREDEPSSLIAFALGSEDYKLKLNDIQKQWKMTHHVEGDDGVLDENKFSGPSDSEAFVSEEELEKSLLRSTGTHLKYQFTEGSCRMLCKIFYAEQFDALRQKCGAADRIIESLSRCLKWDSKGGKTKSVFLKTLDDRLVMKSLSPIETSAFLRFAPAYFNIMAEALFHDLPSVIAKMLGFYQVIIKNPATGTEIKLDLLVMENLFYDRSPTRIFDLKGSMRNRKIQSTGEQNEVLLDENMVEYIYESPLFAREHSKKLLRASVWNDTLFLARQNVMDYSLMIAVDEHRKELVVGIIDCIRTYTWDKRLESWIKDRGFAGGGRNRPTVTSPKEYKSRFREAMARYILQAPNCWHHFGVLHPGGGGPGGSGGLGPNVAQMTRFDGDV